MFFDWWRKLVCVESKGSRRERRKLPHLRRANFKPWAEVLEDRVAPAIFNVPGRSEPGTNVPDLATAIALADSNSDAENIINLAPGNYTVVNQAILAPATKTLSIVGQGPGVTLSAAGQGRVFTIYANVDLENLTITGGKVQSSSARTPAQGGGLEIDGGTVTLTQVNVTGNAVYGTAGIDGVAGAPGAGQGRAGTDGTGGDEADGGGIYVAGGSLTLTDSSVSGNQAVGGPGGRGGDGGYASITSHSGDWVDVLGRPVHGQVLVALGGPGGSGGGGGGASGGGIYLATGSLTLSNSAMSGNQAIGGLGAGGGTGETTKPACRSFNRG
jgi:hypothetical protein